LFKLLDAKKTYWKQRFGNENTKLFHAIATQKFRRNHISQLQLQDGSMAVEHEHKAAVLWTSFKEWLGQSEFDHMLFDLDSLIQPVNLEGPDDSFTNEEVDALITELPTDKAPGPDGFNFSSRNVGQSSKGTFMPCFRPSTIVRLIWCVSMDHL
jgi:hypothetical protein